MKILQNYKKAIILRIYFLLRDNLTRLVLHPFFVSIKFISRLQCIYATILKTNYT